MSFILDALRKSESERQQDARPSITRIPDAMPPRGVPVWALTTMATLGFGIVVLAAAWWSTSGPSAGTAAGAPSAPTTAAADSAGRADASGAAGPTATASPALSAPRSDRIEALDLPPPTEPRRDTQTAAGTLAAAAQGGRSRLREAAAPAESPAPAAPVTAGGGASGSSTAGGGSAQRAGSLPSLDPTPGNYSTMAPSLGLPTLTLELLAYSENSAQRFVFINGQRYTEGDTLEQGPRLVGITAQGAVLQTGGGRQLQLTAR